jgi:DNA-binding NarL/FixJ family response regulator
LRRDAPGVHLVAIGTPLRQAAMDPTIDVAVETPEAGCDDLVAATRGHKPQRTAQLIREQRRWREVTPRQRDVMRWLAVGLENVAIGRKLGIGDRAVKAHITRLLVHFQLSNRTQLALLADRAGVTPPLARIAGRGAHGTS